MSTSPSSPSATGGSTAAHTQAVATQRRGAATASAGTDLFSNLLSLLSADPLTTAAQDDLTSGGALADAASDAQPGTAPEPQNPLAALLAWTGAQSPAPVAAAGEGATALPATGTASLTAGARPVGGPEAQALALTNAQSQTSERMALSEPATGRFTPPTAGTAEPAPMAAPTAPNLSGPVAASDATGGPAPGERHNTGTHALPATRITAWRSTTALATSSARGTEPTRQPGRIAEAAATPASGATAMAAAGPDEAAAVALPATGTPGADRPAAGGPLPGTAASTTGSSGGSTDGGAAGGGSDPQPDHAATTRENGDVYPQTADNEATPADWTSPHLRHAHVRVGEAGEDAIDIQLSLDGQEVQVHFQTDDAQARDNLAREAGAALGELLQRSGMELGSVSVGGQHTPSSQQQTGGQAGQPGPQAASPSPRRTAAAPEASAAPPAPRRDGSRPLDLFV